MRLIIRTIFVAVSLLLSACLHQVTNPHLPPCQSQCEQRFNACQVSCNNSCEQCLTLSTGKAALHHTYYTHEKEIQSAWIIHDRTSFKDPLQCRKVTCACSADRQVCMQACGGSIPKQLRVAPLCE